MFVMTSCRTLVSSPIPIMSQEQNTETPPLPTISQTVPTENQDSTQYVFYAISNNLIRSDLDGSNKIILDSGEYIDYKGRINNWVYYTDKDNKLYKIDVNGHGKTLISDALNLDVIVQNDIVYYFESDKIYKIKGDESTAQLCNQVPKYISKDFKGLISDGPNLYLYTWSDEAGACNLYRCDLNNGNISLVLKHIYDGGTPFLIYNGSIIEGNDNILKKDIKTGKKETMVQYDGGLYHMSIYKDWLVYITYSLGDNYKYINGYNFNTGKTFRTDSPGDFIYEVLPSQLIIYNSSDDQFSRLNIEDNNAHIETFLN